MTTALGTFTNDQLDSIADDNDALNFSQENYVETGSELYRDYAEKLSACYTGDATTGTTEPDTTEVTGTTDGSGTTEAPDTTEASGTTDAAETTETPQTTEG